VLFQGSKISKVTLAKNDPFACRLPPGKAAPAIDGIGFEFGWHEVSVNT
jgi:hypothetical protein